jgi:hypothetical protein
MQDQDIPNVREPILDAQNSQVKSMQVLPRSPERVFKTNIHRIPEEILGDIFLQLHPRSSNFKDLLSAMLVCSRWNHLAERAPQLWRVLDIDLPGPAVDRLTRWIKLSKSAPLLLTFNVANGLMIGMVSPLLKLIYAELHRWDSLHVNGSDLLRLLQILSDSKALDPIYQVPDISSKIQTLPISSLFFSSTGPSHMNRIPDAIGILFACPKLRNLIIRSPFPRLRLQEMETLSDLKLPALRLLIFSPSIAPSFFDQGPLSSLHSHRIPLLTYLLSASPSVERLVIECAISEEYEYQVKALRPLILQSLKRLEFAVQAVPEVGQALLRNLVAQAPRLEEIILKDAADGAGQGVLSLTKRQLPWTDSRDLQLSISISVIRSLDIFKAHVAKLSSFLQAFPNIWRLSIQCIWESGNENMFAFVTHDCVHHYTKSICDGVRLLRNLKELELRDMILDQDDYSQLCTEPTSTPHPNHESPSLTISTTGSALISFNTNVREYLIIETFPPTFSFTREVRTGFQVIKKSDPTNT